jgi:hypothetical protein
VAVREHRARPSPHPDHHGRRGIHTVGTGRRNGNGQQGTGYPAGPRKPPATGRPGDIAPGLPALADGVGAGQGLLVEALLTLFLVFVVFGTGVDPRFGARVGGLAIGFTVTLGLLAAAAVGGASGSDAC